MRARHRADPPRVVSPQVLLVLAAVLGVVLGAGAATGSLGAPGGAGGPAAADVDLRDVAPVGAVPAPAPAPTEPGPTDVELVEIEPTDGPTATTGAGAGTVPGPAAPARPEGAGAAEAAGAVPVSLRAVAIDLDVDALDLLGVAADGTVEVPADPEDAGWLTESARPGSTGPAVLVGHVDSVAGPAVFARLDELAPEDEVEVGLSDGTVVTYRVVAADTYPKDRFPTAAVYGPAPAPVLRLVTCGGRFDRGEASYEDNVVVYAVLAG